MRVSVQVAHTRLINGSNADVNVVFVKNISIIIISRIELVYKEGGVIGVN